MNKKHGLLVLALAGMLSLAPLPAFSGSLDSFSDALESLADMTRAADRAHDALSDAMRGDRDYSGMIVTGSMPNPALNGHESVLWRISRE